MATFAERDSACASKNAGNDVMLVDIGWGVAFKADDSRGGFLPCPGGVEIFTWLRRLEEFQLSNFGLELAGIGARGRGRFDHGNDMVGFRVGSRGETWLLTRLLTRVRRVGNGILVEGRVL